MKKVLTFLILGVTVVMALTFAAYIVLGQFRPEVEMRRMAIAMARLSSFSHDVGFGWSQDDVATTLYASGSLQTDVDNVVEHETSFRVVRISQADEYSDLSGEIKSINQKTYLTYNTPGPSVPGVSFAEETWVEFNEGEIERWGEIVPGLDAPLALITPLTGWDPEATARLRYMLALTDVVIVVYDGLIETIDTMEMRIIDGRFEKDALSAFLLDLVRAKSGQEPEDADRILADAQAAQLAGLTLRFWIGAEDHLLYRLQAADDFFDIRIDFSEFNAQVNIEAPTNTTLFQEILKTALPESAGATSVFGDSQLVTNSTARLPVIVVEESDDADGDGLDDLLEGFYGTDRSRADTDGDGVNDGDEVRSGKNPRGKGSLFSFGLGL